MDMDIISFADDDQIYFDDHSFSQADYQDFAADSYDTDPEDELGGTPCGVSSVAVCAALASQHQAVQAVGAAWRKQRTASSTGLNGDDVLAVGEEEQTFEFDQCCFFNPFDWTSNNSHHQPGRPSGYVDEFNPAGSSSSSRYRGGVSITSMLCNSTLADPFLLTSCGCGSSCSGCSASRQQPLHTHHSPLQATTNSSSAAVMSIGSLRGRQSSNMLYSNSSSSYSLNESIDSLSGMQQQTNNSINSNHSNTNTVFLPPLNVPGIGGIVSDESEMSRGKISIISSNNANDRHGVVVKSSNGGHNHTISSTNRTYVANGALTSGLTVDEARLGIAKEQASEPQQTQPQSWRPNLSSYSANATTMASYFWPNSFR